MTTPKKKRKAFELGQRTGADIALEREQAGCDRHYAWNKEGIKYTKPERTADADGEFVKHVAVATTRGGGAFRGSRDLEGSAHARGRLTSRRLLRTPSRGGRSRRQGELHGIVQNARRGLRELRTHDALRKPLQARTNSRRAEGAGQGRQDLQGDDLDEPRRLPPVEHVDDNEPTGVGCCSTPWRTPYTRAQTRAVPSAIEWRDRRASRASISSTPFSFPL